MLFREEQIHTRQKDLFSIAVPAIRLKKAERSDISALVCALNKAKGANGTSLQFDEKDSPSWLQHIPGEPITRLIFWIAKRLGWSVDSDAA